MACQLRLLAESNSKIAILIVEETKFAFEKKHLRESNQQNSKFNCNNWQSNIENVKVVI